MKKLYALTMVGIILLSGCGTPSETSNVVEAKEETKGLYVTVYEQETWDGSDQITHFYEVKYNRQSRCLSERTYYEGYSEGGLSWKDYKINGEQLCGISEEEAREMFKGF